MKLFKLFFLSIFLTINLSAFDEFLVSDIRIIGLQRVSIGSIFNVIPIGVGDKINTRKSSDITKSLFSTEQFDDIQIARDGNTLIISVVERPSISGIEISGNKFCKISNLFDSLLEPEIIISSFIFLSFKTFNNMSILKTDFNSYFKF